MTTSSLISNSNSVTDDLDEDDYVSDEDNDDYFDRVERATGAFSEFSNQER